MAILKHLVLLAVVAMCVELASARIWGLFDYDYSNPDNEYRDSLYDTRYSVQTPAMVTVRENDDGSLYREWNSYEPYWMPPYNPGYY